MIEFLVTLLILVFSFNADVIPPTVAEEVISKLENKFPQIEDYAPDNFPFDKLTDNSTPAYENQANENGTENNAHGGQENSNNEEDPNTEKVPAFNTKSEKPIGEVAAIAVEKAEPLVACSDNPKLCITPTPPPDDNQSLAVTSTPSPLPIPTYTPEPTTFPIIIDPPITHIPIEPPIDPCKCDGPKTLCPMIYPCLLLE